jgi:hypothetical protein
MREGDVGWYCWLEILLLRARLIILCKPKRGAMVDINSQSSEMV